MQTCMPASMHANACCKHPHGHTEMLTHVCMRVVRKQGYVSSQIRYHQAVRFPILDTLIYRDAGIPDPTSASMFKRYQWTHEISPDSICNGRRRVSTAAEHLALRVCYCYQRSISNLSTDAVFADILPVILIVISTVMRSLPSFDLLPLATCSIVLVWYSRATFGYVR